jgi:DNA replication and repair protein RecF
LLKLDSISLVQFKNYNQASFTFNDRITGIAGKNGVGKTNLLDAIYYCCFTKSYFARSDGQNVLKGAAGFRIEAHFTLQGEPLKVVCILRETGKKEFLLNDEPYEKFAHHIGRFPCVIIAPDDIQIITGGSEERRRFLDTLLSQLDATYLQQLIDYNRVLQQRNSFLKSLAEKRLSDTSLLEVYDEQLGRYGTYVYEKRKNFLRTFIPAVQKFYQQIAGIDEQLDIIYESQLLQYSFKDLFFRFREKDILLQRTTGGIHKDDLDIQLQQQSFKLIASQGQRKSLLFALKLAEFEALKSAKGFAPLLLLDDVFEKLDEQRMHNLLSQVCVENEGQLFITDTHEERIHKHFSNLVNDFQIICL